MIKLENVNKHYKTLHVLKDINLEFEDSKITVIIGPSGSGKTTLLYAINRLEKIDTGKILVNDIDIHSPKTDISKIRKDVGLVFQNYSLFSHLNVMENIILAPMSVRKISKNKAESLAISLLDKVGLKDKKFSFPSQLSGGQQQRIALVRALAMEPIRC